MEVNGGWDNTFSSVFFWYRHPPTWHNLLISNIEYCKINLQKLLTDCLEIGMQGQAMHLEQIQDKALEK